ncbi:hypothetical protein [Marinicella meishanensis]|uniref:hypothetical protein n=1 Tax=Marinicella meishanensis TaxID=2873263 RepID=UPI001CBF20FA|nr:hypothetical protein [Marinicella sp. NBU2979]
MLTATDDKELDATYSPDGHLRSSHPIQRPPDMAPFRIIRPSFDPLHDRLIFSTGRQLFTLSYTG